MTCIECPKGCRLTLEPDGSHVLRVSGHKCPKGELYAKQEFENPLRILTTSVLAEGLTLKMIPVKTSQPIPKAKLLEAMEQIRRIKVQCPVNLGEVIQANFGNFGVDLVATRSAQKPKVS
jgi:CxxC motif-containing protein